MKPLIIKGDGTKEEFDVTKLISSLIHAGADPQSAQKIAEHVSQIVKDGMTTTEIYEYAFKHLHREERILAARYSMRRAILELGPSGFPFEDYIGALMTARGYSTRVRVVVRGRCVEHEVDVVLKKDGHSIGAELKFHNTPGFKTDLKTALYVRARFWDIEWGAEDRKEKSGIDEGWLITNTKFSGSAIDYAECTGLKLLGWSYPHGASLSDLIHETKIYPITVLTSLSNNEKTRLLSSGVTMCSMVYETPEKLTSLGIPGRKVKQAITESTNLCKP